MQARFLGAVYGSCLANKMVSGQDKIINTDQIKYFPPGYLRGPVELLLFSIYHLLFFGEYHESSYKYEIEKWAKDYKHLAKFNIRKSILSPEHSKNSSCLIVVPAFLLEKEPYGSYLIAKSEEARDCCRLYHHLLKTIAKSKKKEEVIKSIINFPMSEKVRLFMASAIKGDKDAKIAKLSENCLGTLYCIIKSFVHFSTFKQALQWVVNLGGSVEINADVVGGLFGFIIGVKKLNKLYEKDLEIIINCNTNIAYYPRNRKFTARNFHRILPGLIDVFNDLKNIEQ